VLTDEQLIQRVRAALESESAGVVPSPGLLARIHEELRSSPAAERHRWRAPSRGLRLRLAHLAPVAAVLVVVTVVAVFLGVQSRKPAGSAAAHGGFALVFRAEPTPQAPVVNQAAMVRAVSLMRRRIAAVVPGGEATIAVTSVGTKIFVHAASQTRISQQQLLSLVGTTARMVFYDWEANALTPRGQTVASLLATRNPTALEISQGGVAGAPGSPGAGSMPLYQAVQLAAKQPYSVSKNNARAGSEYFAFGAPDSPACTEAAHHYKVTPVVGQHCYLAGPADNLQDLYSSLPTNVSASEAQVLTVQRGTVVLQAVPASFTHAPAWSDPNAQFYVLRDHVSLFGTDVTNPRQSTDQSGAPDVTFGFTGKGSNEFQNVTAQIAHRGDLVSGFGTQLNQHFAVALDTQLITVPLIDFKTYPDGIQGGNGGDITGGFTIQSAQDLATQLRLGWLPINLKLIAIVPQH
jgi:SecD/SecF fusion protein